MAKNLAPNGADDLNFEVSRASDGAHLLTAPWKIGKRDQGK